MQLVIPETETASRAETIHRDLVRRVGDMIEHYRADLLEHDLAAIEANPDARFLHQTRTTGTHIQVLAPAGSDYWPAPGARVPFLFGTITREELAETLARFVRAWEPGSDTDPRVIHYYNGSAWREITHPHAIQLAQEHRDSVLAAWKRDAARRDR